MATVVRSFAVQGIDEYPVDIETKTLEGQPVISIIGLGDLAVKEAAERIQTSIDETAHRLLKIFGNPEAVYRADTGDFYKIKGITQRQISSILNHRSLKSVYEIMEDCEKYNISILTQKD